MEITQEGHPFLGWPFAVFRVLKFIGLTCGRFRGTLYGYEFRI